MREARRDPVPVIALTGHLGAGKTTVLNHLLRQPGARVGVVVNDFGDINVDAGLVAGQIDEPASIAGGCLCCLPDAGGLDDALSRLSHPRLGLDAVIVEASGLAEPAVLARRISSTRVRRVRPAGVIEVVDAVEYFATVDRDPYRPAPMRFAVASLVLVTKTDRLAGEQRDEALRRIVRRVRERNAATPVVPAPRGRIDPSLVYDATLSAGRTDELPFEVAPGCDDVHHPGEHLHADSVTVTSPGPVEPARVLDLLAEPPARVYRAKGRVHVATPTGLRAFTVHLVGRAVTAHPALTTGRATSELVAIGIGLDRDDVRERLADALARAPRASDRGYRDLQRQCALSA